MSDGMQELIVGLAAGAALLYLLRGIVQAVRPRPRPPACDHCAVADLAESLDATGRNPRVSPPAAVQPPATLATPARRT